MSEPIRLSDEQLGMAWSEFTYPRPASGDPTAAFVRAVRYIDGVLPLIVAAELDRLVGVLNAEAVRQGKRDGMFADGTENGLQTAATRLYLRAHGLRSMSRGESSSG